MIINATSVGAYPYLSDFDFVTEEMKWKSVFEQIRSISFLEPNWDGEDSEAIDPALIESLTALLKRIKLNSLLQAPDRVLATQDGSLIVEWQFSNCILELESDTPGMGEFMLTPEDGETTFKELIWEQPSPSFDEYFGFPVVSNQNATWSNVA